MKQSELQNAWEQAYSMENMAAHEAEGRQAEYVGSMSKGKRIYDFYRDDAGAYWYLVRIILVTGEVVPEQEAIFGKKKKRSGKRF